MRKINIAIIDHNLLHRSVTHQLLEDYLSHSHFPVSLSEFDSGPELIQEISLTGQYDIYIMEVAMPVMNGISLAEQLRSRGDQGIIIYLTKDPGSAYRAFGVKAADYLLKPIRKERFVQALDDAFIELNRQYVSPVIEIKIKTGLMRVPIDNITHVDIVDRALCFHLSNGIELTTSCIRNTFHQAIEETMGILISDFIYAGRAHLINLCYIMELEKDQIVLTTGEKVSIPKSAIPPIRAAWLSQRLIL